MSEFVILSDSSCDLPESLIKEYNLQIVSFYVSFDKENYLRENIDINIDEFYTNLIEKKIIPKTSLPSMDDYIRCFKPILEQGKDILCFTLSSELSGSYQSAFNAANMMMEEYPERQIKVMDSRNATVAQGLVILEGAKMQKNGHSLEEVYEKMLEIRDETLIIFTIDTLEYLQKGGRIGKVSALAGSLLNIKPIILFRKGNIEPYSKVRGRKKSISEIINLFSEKLNENSLDKYEIAIAHAHCLDEALEFKKELEEKLGINFKYPVFDIGVTIGTHTGPSTLGVGFIKRYNS